MHLSELDVDTFRARPRSLFVRRIDGPVLVLGSRQGVDDFETDARAFRELTTVHRRSPGGAVLLDAGDPLWVDIWLPRGDPQWSDDVVEACIRLGEWWQKALQVLVDDDLWAHRGKLEEGPRSDLSCFAAIGPGEVLARGRKLLGLAQWRCKQGALFQCAVYWRFFPEGLANLLTLDEEERNRLARSWRERATGLAALIGSRREPRARLMSLLIAELERQLPDDGTWQIRHGEPLEIADAGDQRQDSVSCASSRPMIQGIINPERGPR